MFYLEFWKKIENMFLTEHEPQTNYSGRSMNFFLKTNPIGIVNHISNAIYQKG